LGGGGGILFAYHVLNKVLHKKLGKTPYETQKRHDLIWITFKYGIV